MFRKSYVFYFSGIWPERCTISWDRVKTRVFGSVSQSCIKAGETVLVAAAVILSLLPNGLDSKQTHNNFKESYETIKQKIMLAAVASVALAAPAFAWDFSASGSALGKFNITNTTVSHWC